MGCTYIRVKSHFEAKKEKRELKRMKGKGLEKGIENGQGMS
jgi:hypothetical protein